MWKASFSVISVLTEVLCLKLNKKEKRKEAWPIWPAEPKKRAFLVHFKKTNDKETLYGLFYAKVHSNEPGGTHRRSANQLV